MSSSIEILEDVTYNEVDYQICKHWPERKVLFAVLGRRLELTIKFAPTNQTPCRYGVRYFDLSKSNWCIVLSDRWTTKTPEEIILSLPV